MTHKADQHDLVSLLLELSKELGRPPKREEFVDKYGINRHEIDRQFGSFSIFKQAAGLKGRNYKPDKQEVRRKVFEHIKVEVQEIKSIIPPPISSRTLIIGDTHFPYTHPDAVEWLIALNRKYNFDLVIHIGDEVDYHAMSFHDSDADLYSAGHELEAAIKMMQPLYKEFPNMRLAHSNHGSMVYRKAVHNGTPRRLLVPYRQALEAPEGWIWEDKIRFQTSDGMMNLVVHSLGANVELVAKSRGMNVIQGHHHEKFCINYFDNEEKKASIFGAQTACLIDDVSFAMAYNKTNKFRPIMGSLGIFSGIPMLFKMLLDKNGRWTGFLP